MRTIDPVTLSRIQKVLHGIVEPALEVLKQLHTNTMLNSSELDKAMEDYYSSGKDFSSVEKRLLDGEIKLLEALDIVHAAIYPTQDLLNSIQRHWYDSIRKNNSEAKLLLKSLKVEVVDANIFKTVGISAEDRKRETMVAVVPAEIIAERISTEFDGAKEKMGWVKEQIAGLNRIDSKIRLAQKIGESIFYQNLTYQGETIL